MHAAPVKRPAVAAKGMPAVAVHVIAIDVTLVRSILPVQLRFRSLSQKSVRRLLAAETQGFATKRR